MSVLDQRTEQQKRIDRRVLQRVKRGYTLLQETFGDSWVDQIDLDRLDLADGVACVLGQVYHRSGNYGGGVKDLFGSDEDDVTPKSHGFLIDDDLAGEINWESYPEFSARPEDTVSLYYQMLTEAWKEEILSRRGR